jgi:two-component system phosphate regulon sensor histidine kinase PhoR
LSGCAILLGDKEKRTLKIVYHKGLNLKPNAQPTIPFNACLSGWCLKNKNHLYTDDLINHPLLYPPNRPLIKKSKLKTLLCIPLIKDNQPIGTLNLYHRGQRQFSEEEIDLLKTAANQIAQAITNIQLYQQTTKFLSRLFLDKQLLDKIFANSADGIMVTDHHFKVIIWNKAMERFTGISAAKAYHQECWKFLCGHGCPKSFTCPAVVKWKKGEQNPYEEINLVGNDRRIWLGGTHSIITDKKGKMIHTVGIFRDITKLKELAQSQNDFISMATHELRTPLTIIKGYLSMLLGGDGGQLNGKQWNFFNKAFQSTERLVDLVEDLLATQRIDQNRLDLSIIPVNIIELIEEIVTDFIHKASEKKIILNFINRPSKAIYALADRLRTKQILSNLIDNAIKYTRESGEVKISYSLGDLNHQLEENYLTIEVMDSGIGIPKEKTNEIFDKFSRLNNPESIKAGGTGLGLYIVKHLIEQQNGQIWVKSNPKKGSVFSFTLPLVPNEQPKSKLI